MQSGMGRIKPVQQHPLWLGISIELIDFFRMLIMIKLYQITFEKRIALNT
jgi:hypothetical protein